MSAILWADLEILARTVYGEARGESHEGKKAVAHVIVNRVQVEKGQFAKDDTIATACLRHVQFSAWNAEDPNFDVLQQAHLNDWHFRECLIAGLEALNEPDFTAGALHYHTLSVSPPWAKGHKPCFAAGVHVFYNDVK